MYKSKWLGIFAIITMTFLLPATTFAEDIQSCGNTAKRTGKTIKGNGSGIKIRTGPGLEFARIVNEKATRIMKRTVYIEIDNTVTVFEECTLRNWSKIRVTDPDYLSQSHRGWVKSKFLRDKKVDVLGREIFTEADFLFDYRTRPYKNIIIAGVNKIHRENSKCKDIDTSSAYISSSKGSKANPVFFVTCGKDRGAFNVFFSKSDVEDDIKFGAKLHISQLRAVNLCENYSKSQASHPSTVDFSRIFGLSVSESPNSRTKVTSTFTAKNAFNLELKYNISCLLDSDGLIEASISEAR